MLVTTTRLVDIGQGREQEQVGKRFKDIVTVAGVVRSFTLEGQQISHFSALLSMHTVTAEDLPLILLLFFNLHTASSFPQPTTGSVSCGPLIYF